MRLLGAIKVSDLNMQHVSNLFGKPFASRTIADNQYDFLDQYKGAGTADLRWACWLGEVEDVGIIEVVGGALRADANALEHETKYGEVSFMSCT